MENLTLIKPEKVQNIINKFCYTIGMIPTSYKVSLTYEEQIIAIGHYLEETVIPALNNNAEAVAELQTLFVQLKDYVENYFDNLDIQNEINTKLDKMAQDGTLQEIIAEYLNTKSLLGFDNVSDMINSENLVEGSYAQTFGFYNANDGGSKKYKIIKEQNAENVNGKTKINLGHDDLYAVSINDLINIKDYGAKGDGIQDDTETIQFCIDNFPHRTLFFPTGNYLISKPLEIYENNESQVDIYFESGSRLFTNTKINSLIEIGNEKPNTSSHWKKYKIGNRVNIFGAGILDANNTNQALLLCANRKNTVIKNIEIINCDLYGINIIKSTVENVNNSMDSKFLNLTITGKGQNPEINSIGINSLVNDCEYNEIRINRFMKAINLIGGGNIIDNIHLTQGFANSQLNIPSNFNKSIGIDITGTNNIFNNIYIDTFGKAVVLRGTDTYTIINNMFTYYYMNTEESKTSIFTLLNKNRLQVSNSRFTLTSLGTNKIIDLSNVSDNGFRRNYQAFDYLKFNNCTSYFAVIDDYDPFKNVQIRNENVVTNVTVPYSVYMEANKYYPICILDNGSFNFKLRMESSEIADVTIYIPLEGLPRITTKSLFSEGTHKSDWTLSLVEKETVDNRRYIYLCVSSTHRFHYNPCIFDIFQGFNCGIYAYPNFNNNNYLVNPNVLVSTPLNQ